MHLNINGDVSYNSDYMSYYRDGPPSSHQVRFYFVLNIIKCMLLTKYFKY